MSQSPARTARDGLRWARRRVTAERELRRVLTERTYGDFDGGFVPLPASWCAVDVPSSRSAEMRELAERILEHEFDLLGSGPFIAERPARDRQRFDPRAEWRAAELSDANRDFALEVARGISPEYDPIDWHQDFGSGHRWDPSEPSARLPIFIEDAGSPADVKLPWELGRMQHLGYLAAAYRGPEPKLGSSFEKSEFVREFQDEIRDFIAACPPGFGVQWLCPMDVAIRGANWARWTSSLIAAGADIDEEFRSCLASSLADHARFISRNLEWDPNVRANHYYADLCGLVVIASALERGPETDAWLRFGVAEFVRETAEQFSETGANLEGSTSYHRLMAEMLEETTVLIDALPAEACAVLEGVERQGDGSSTEAHFAPGPAVPSLDAPLYPLPESHRSRVEAVRDYSARLARAGELPLVGDDDDGAFFGFPRPHRKRFDPDPEAEDRIEILPRALVDASDDADFVHKSELVHLVKRGSWFITFRCGPVGQRGNGGHDHVDQLGITISHARELVVTDPGTFTYSRDPEKRNEYRSRAVHAVPLLREAAPPEFGRGRDALFTLASQRGGELVSIDESRVVGRWTSAGGVQLERDIEIVADRVRGRDEIVTGGGPLRVHFPLAPEVDVEAPEAGLVRWRRGGRAYELSVDGDPASFRMQIAEAEVSERYGFARSSRRIEIETDARALQWMVREI